MLFDVLRQRTATGTTVPYSSSLSAEEVFAKWNQPGILMQCQQVTFLFVALARALGITSYAVNVQEAWDGDKSSHACAAVFIGSETLLVDPTCPWFGVAHRRFMVLDDLQAMAVHLCMQTDLERNRIAAKLAPELALVQARLCANLINLGHWTEAMQLLPTVLRLDTTGAFSLGLQAGFALHDGHVAQAESLLHQSLRIDPWNSGLHFQLGNAYAAEGKLKEARESYIDALGCPHTDEQAARFNRAIARLAGTNEPKGLRHDD
jgi:tetratricopeptide (TPR) repeat protein